MRRRRRRPGENERKNTRNKVEIRWRGRFFRYRTVLDPIHVWEPRGPSPWGGTADDFDEVSDDDSEGEAAAALLEQLRK
eukprot:gene20822-biopygen13137